MHDPFSARTAWKGMEVFLPTFLNRLDPVNTIVELGVDMGYSFFRLAERWPDATVIGVDNFSYEDGEVAKGRVQHFMDTDSRFKNCRLWHEHTVKAAKFYYLNMSKKIDLLHIDADHMYGSIERDFNAWMPLVRSGGAIMFHDIESFPNDVGRFFYELVGEKVQTRHKQGLGVWFKS